MHAACDLIRLWFRAGAEWGGTEENVSRRHWGAVALNNRTLSPLVRWFPVCVRKCAKGMFLGFLFCFIFY